MVRSRQKLHASPKQAKHLISEEGLKQETHGRLGLNNRQVLDTCRYEQKKLSTEVFHSG